MTVTITTEQLAEEGITCPECHSKMIVRSGKFGQFAGCSMFPSCRGTRSLSECGYIIVGEADVPGWPMDYDDL